MRSEDWVRLRHMVEAAQEAIRLAEGSSQGDLKKDRTQSLAVVRLIEIVGEAASHVSDDCKGRLPDVPWQNIIGMRNRIVHAYFDKHGHSLAHCSQVPAGSRPCPGINSFGLGRKVK